MQQTFLVKQLRRYMKVKETPANFNPASVHPNWTGLALFADKELELLDKYPNNAVADFRLVVGIPADPWIASANLLVDAKNRIYCHVLLIFERTVLLSMFMIPA